MSKGAFVYTDSKSDYCELRTDQCRNEPNEVNTQGAIHKLAIQACLEGSKNKLLQAMLLDPTVSTYNQCVALIDDMCQRQKSILPEMRW